MILSITILLVISASYAYLTERGRGKREELQRHYLQSILLYDTHSERYVETIAQLSGARSKRIAAEVIASLTPIIYRVEQNQLIRLADSLNLVDFLLKRATTHEGTERAESLATLSLIPTNHLTAQQLEPFEADADRRVRFFALRARINIDRGNAMRHVAAYDSPLTPLELSLLLSLLRQGAVAVAYEPMLNSSSVNLNQLGMAVVREFGVESAEPQLRKMLGQEQERVVRTEALHTLAALHLTLNTPTICSLLHTLTHAERGRFLRYAAYEGYSQRVLDHLCTPLERRQLHSLIDSYKVKLSCSQLS